MNCYVQKIRCVHCNRLLEYCSDQRDGDYLKHPNDGLPTNGVSRFQNVDNATRESLTKWVDQLHQEPGEIVVGTAELFLVPSVRATNEEGKDEHE